MSGRPAQFVPPPPPRGARRAQSADQFRLMADYAPVMIWVANPDRKSVYFNRPWLEFTGRPLEAELGLGWTDGIHAGDRDRLLGAYSQAFDACVPFEAEYRLRRRDGEYRWLLAKGAPLVHESRLCGFVASCVDITDRMAAEQSARKREADFKRLAENIPDVIARIDRDLRCVYANPAIEQALGRKAESFIGARLDEVRLPPAIAAAIETAVKHAFETAKDQRFGFETTTGGATRHFVGRVVPELAAQRVEAVLVIAYDETPRVQEDARRAALLARERSARENAETANLARDQFLAIVSHELRSPLNGIKSWTHVLENRLRDAEPAVQRALAGIMIGVEHQVRLIDDLLDVTRAMSGNLALAKQPMPLVPVLADAVESLRALALEKGLRIVTDLRMGDREIHGDPDRIRQIFLNLLSNAVKFTPPGGTVWVSAREEEGNACIEVRDTGSGVAPEFLPYIFDPFRQADQGAATRGSEGLGLGLALVQRLAELHGGRVACESAGRNQGATFRVYLPLLQHAGTRVVLGSEARSKDAVPTVPSLSGIRVLLIDDQREARESLAALLGEAGASVTTAASGREALSLLESENADETPLVIVCDIAMPDEDGYETLRRIRRWESDASVGTRRPAIALSAFTQREHRIRALSEGFQMHLTKPVAPAELLIVISSAARGMRV
jgi:PAS domain S-box-containing protein